MSNYMFCCPACGQQYGVTEPTRTATMTSGCPVCGEAVTAAHFQVHTS